MAALVTAASACSFYNNVMLLSQNYGIKGIKRDTSLGQGQGLGVKRCACCGGLQIKANAQNYNADDKISKAVSTSSVRQNFTIRSYELDANGIASIETLMNYFQSAVVNIFKTVGTIYDVFGSTKEMIKRNLIWVTIEMQVVTYRYPTWDDVVEVEAWLSPAGKNPVRFNWILRDFRTNEVLIKASRYNIIPSFLI
ncbi:hypothetical protein AHAS_Ahas13G0254400 [Arachis hypogaea]